MPLRPRRDLQRRFWLLIRAGESVLDASAHAGVAFGTGGRGSVMQVACHHPPSSGRFLSIEEREVIHAGVHQNLSIRAIAIRIDRHPSTVLRELRDNMHHQQYRSRSSLNPSAAGHPRSTGWNYSPHLAQNRADNNATRSRNAKLKTNHRLRDDVQRRLKKKFSPEQIAKRLRIDYPARPANATAGSPTWSTATNVPPRSRTGLSITGSSNLTGQLGVRNGHAPVLAGADRAYAASLDDRIAEALSLIHI